MIRGLFILFISTMIFMKYPGRKPRLTPPSLIDFIFIAFSIGTLVTLPSIMTQWPGVLDHQILTISFGNCGVLIVLEGCRRALSFILPIISLCALLFAFAGPYLPGILEHHGFSFTTVIGDTYASMNGIFGIVLYVFPPMSFSLSLWALFSKHRCRCVFIDFPVALTSKYKEGTCEAVVFSVFSLA
jgi:TRAP-type uncharacterized transport system fused permease subunit